MVFFAFADDVVARRHARLYDFAHEMPLFDFALARSATSDASSGRPLAFDSLLGCTDGLLQQFFASVKNLKPELDPAPTFGIDFIAKTVATKTAFD